MASRSLGSGDGGGSDDQEDVVNCEFLCDHTDTAGSNFLLENTM